MKQIRIRIQRQELLFLQHCTIGHLSTFLTIVQTKTPISINKSEDCGTLVVINADFIQRFDF